MAVNFNKQPIREIPGKEKLVYIFDEKKGANIDEAIVNSFGEEWLKFSNFKEKEINQ